MDLSTFFRVLLRHWWLILLSIITTAGSAAWVVSHQTPRYSATAQVWLRPNEALEDSREVVETLNVLDRRSIINTVARMATSASMLSQISQTLGIHPIVIEESELTATVLPETNLIDIRATDTDSERVAAIVNAVAEELRKQIPDKALQLDITTSAVPPTESVYPQPVRTITLGVLFGLALGVMFALGNYMLQQLSAAHNQDALVEDRSGAGDELDGVESASGQAQTRQLFTRSG